MCTATSNKSFLLTLHHVTPALMSQSIPAGIFPPENSFERANPGHPGKFVC